jgi:acyl-CoA dehydrogenase
MDFHSSERGREYQRRLLAFMDEHVYPAEAPYEEEMRRSGDPHPYPAILDRLKERAREAGLWNLMGRSIDLAPEATNCNAPDTGNMGILAAFGTRRKRSVGFGRCSTGRSDRRSR